MKIDLHLHCSERSSCSIATEQQHIKAAIENGLDAIVITDHDKLVPEEHLKELNEKYYPFKIFGGIEIRTEPYGEDVLVIGVKERLLQEKKWTYEELYGFVKERGGFIVLCHPYRYSSEIKLPIEKFIPDGIELHSTNIGRCDNNIIKALAKRLGCKLLGNSDGHNEKHTGIFYNIIDGNPSTEAELAEVLLGQEIVIGRDESRIEVFNKVVRNRENIIKQFLEEGKSSKQYHDATGEWTGCFDRVAMGKSYEI